MGVMAHLDSLIVRRQLAMTESRLLRLELRRLRAERRRARERCVC